MDLQSKIEKIKNILRDKKVIVAFSGGADSTLIAKLAMEAGKKAIAVTIDTGVLPPRCVENAKHIAAKIGIPHHIHKENILQYKDFKKNPPYKCFLCKDRMYNILESMARNEGFDLVVDGTNVTDMLEDRPGVIANYKRNIVSPLLLAKMGHDEVLEYLRREGIDHSMNTTCLATRIKRGPITPQKLEKISEAENIIEDLTDLEVIRVRELEGNAIIEVEDVKKLLNIDLLGQIEAELKAAKFRKIYLDIEGYRKDKSELLKKYGREDEIIFELKLPYPINMEETFNGLKKAECSPNMDILTVKIKNAKVKLSQNGEIKIMGVEDKSKAEEIIMDILTSIRRSEKLN